MDHIEYDGKTQDESLSFHSIILESTAVIVLVTPPNRPSIRTALQDTRTLRPASERTLRAGTTMKNKEHSTPVFSMMTECSPSQALQCQSSFPRASSFSFSSSTCHRSSNEVEQKVSEGLSEVDEIRRRSTYRTMTIRQGRLSTRMTRSIREESIASIEDCAFVPEIVEELSDLEDAQKERYDDDNDDDHHHESRTTAITEEEEEEEKDKKNDLLSPAIDNAATIVIEAVDQQYSTLRPDHIRDTHKHVVEQFGTLRGETLKAECYRVVVRDLEKEKEWRPKANMLVLQEEETKAKMKMKRMIKRLVNDLDNYERM